MLEKEKFRLYDDSQEKSKDKVIGVKMNPKEQEWLNKMCVLLQQEKGSTALKQLSLIGAKVVLDTPQGIFFQTVIENIRKNKRLGIDEVELKTETKVLQK